MSVCLFCLWRQVSCTKMHFQFSNFSGAKAWTCGVCMWSKLHSSPCMFATLLSFDAVWQELVCAHILGWNLSVHRLFSVPLTLGLVTLCICAPMVMDIVGMYNSIFLVHEQFTPQQGCLNHLALLSHVESRHPWAGFLMWQQPNRPCQLLHAVHLSSRDARDAFFALWHKMGLAFFHLTCTFFLIQAQVEARLHRLLIWCSHSNCCQKISQV